ncbi:MAG: replication protein [Cressdnaviricota sp.]|nr:MAG: replication protein [Cressdnaviricota sp.]
MEDTIIIKTQYAYMLRADIMPAVKDTNVVVKDHLSAWIESSGCSFYLGCKERGEITGKLHYQMIVWFETKLSGKEMTKQRNWWRGKCGNHRNNHAFTSARKVATLASYSIKEKGELITNLSCAQLKLIPKWKNKKALKETNKEKFLKILVERLESFRKKCVTCIGIDSAESYGASPWDPYRQGNPDYETFCKMLNDCYKEIFGESCCYRNTYFKLAKAHGIISHREFLMKIGVLTI